MDPKPTISAAPLETDDANLRDLAWPLKLNFDNSIKDFVFFIFLSELIMNLLEGNQPDHQDGCVRLTNKIIDDIINLDFIFPESSQLIWTHLSLIISRHTWDVVRSSTI